MNDQALDSMPFAAQGFLLVLVVCLHAAGAAALSRLPGPTWHGEKSAILRASWIENAPSLSAPSLSLPPPSVEPARLHPVPPPLPPARSAKPPRQRVRPEVSVPSQRQTSAAQSAPVPAVVDTAPDVSADLAASEGSPPAVSAAVATSEAAGGEERGWGRDYVGPDFNVSYFSNPEPEYPSLSRRQREQGLVKLRVHVTEEGRAGEVMLHMSSGYERLDRAALDAVKRWRFRPAQRKGMPVAGWVVVPVRFELQG